MGHFLDDVYKNLFVVSVLCYFVAISCSTKPLIWADKVLGLNTRISAECRKLGK